MDADRGSRFDVVLQVYGGTVALLLESMSCFSSLPDHPPLSSYRSGKSVRVVTYGRTLRAIKESMTKSGRKLEEFALN